MADAIGSGIGGNPASGIYSDFGALNNLKLQSRENPEAALGEVASQFESLFITMMMKAMRDTLPDDGLFASSQMETYQDMFDQQLALDLSRNNGVGLASVIERQLSAAQRYSGTEESAATAPPMPTAPTGLTMPERE